MYELIFSRATLEGSGNCAIYGTSPANRDDLKHKNRAYSYSVYHYACPVPEVLKNLKK